MYSRATSHLSSSRRFSSLKRCVHIAIRAERVLHKACLRVARKAFHQLLLRECNRQEAQRLESLGNLGSLMFTLLKFPNFFNLHNFLNRSIHHHSPLLSSERGRYNARHIKQQRVVLRVYDPLLVLYISGSRCPVITIKLNIVRERWRHHIPKLIISPSVSNRGDCILQLLDIVQGYEFHSCILEIRQPLEVVREVAAHL